MPRKQDGVDIVAAGVGGAPFVKISAHFGGSAPLKFLHWLSFSEFIGFASMLL